MDFFKGNEDLEDQIYESLKQHGLIDGVETDFGGQKYTLADGEYYQQGQLGGEEGYAVPVMVHNDWQVPVIKPDKENWQAKNRFSEGLKRFEDCTKEVGDLFESYDMTRLEVPQKHIASSYTETILSEVKSNSIIRDPPSWVVELLRKKGNRTFKVATNRTEKFSYDKEVVYPSAEDIVLSSNVGEFKTGIFLSPAYYKFKRKIDIMTQETDTAYEIRYWFKGKYQTRFLSKSQEVFYHVSDLGADTLVSNKSKGSGKEGSFQHTCTDFFFFGSEMEYRHLQYFQTEAPLGMRNDVIFRKSSVWNTYKLVFDLNSYVMFKHPIFGLVEYTEETFRVKGIPMEFGRNFIYRIKRVWVERVDPSIEWIDKVRRDLGVDIKIPKKDSKERQEVGKKTQKKKKKPKSVRAEIRTSVVQPYVPRDRLIIELTPGKLVENFQVWGKDKEVEICVELELQDFVPQHIDVHGRMEDFKDDLDPWEGDRKSVV